MFRTAVDPMGLGIGDAIFGKQDGPDYSEEEAAQAAAQRAAYVPPSRLKIKTPKWR